MWKDVWKTYVSRNILMLAWNHLWLFKNSSNPITVQSKLAHYPSQVMSSVAIIVCDWFKIWQTILSIWKKLFLKFRSRIISPSSSLKPPSLWRLKEFFEDKENITLRNFVIAMIFCFCLFNFLFTLFISESKSRNLLRHIVCIFDFILLFSFPHPFLRRRKPSSPWQCNQNPPPWSSPHSPFMHNAYYEMTTCYIFDKDFVHVNVTLSIHYVITKKNKLCSFR